MPKLTRSRYRNSEAVSAMGAKADDNPLNHDRYTDGEAADAAVAQEDIADAITKEHTQNTDTAQGAQTEDLDMNDNQIINVTDPTDDQDAATKKYTDDSVYESTIKASRARAYRTTSNQVLETGISTKVEFNAENYDEQDEFDHETNYRFTALKTGYYQVNAQIQFNSGATGRYLSQVKKNGSTIALGETQGSGNGTRTKPQTSDIIYLAVDDYLELWGYQDTGGDVTIQAYDNSTFMSIHKLS